MLDFDNSDRIDDESDPAELFDDDGVGFLIAGTFAVVSLLLVPVVLVDRLLRRRAR